MDPPFEMDDSGDYYLGMWSPGADKHCVPYKFKPDGHNHMISASLNR